MENVSEFEKIIDYYESCHNDYKAIWKLDQVMALHYGYWDEKVQNFEQSLIRMNEVLAKEATICKADYVLDAGCGVGGSSIFLAEKFGCRLHGISICKNQIEEAKKYGLKSKAKKLLQFSRINYESTGFLDNTFDVVWGLESVCYADKAKFIAEAYRILKKGGRLIIADGFLTKSDLNLKEKYLMKKWLDGWAVNSLDTPGQFKEKAEAAGFKNVRYGKITKYVMASSKRLYYFSLPALLVTRFCNVFKIRNMTQTGNVEAARFQFISMKKGLWEYGTFYAEK